MVQLADILIAARFVIIRPEVVRVGPVVILICHVGQGKLISNGLAYWIDQRRRNYVVGGHAVEQTADRGRPNASSKWLRRIVNGEARVLAEVSRALLRGRDIEICVCTDERLCLPYTLFRKPEEGFLQVASLIAERHWATNCASV